MAVGEEAGATCAAATAIGWGVEPLFWTSSEGNVWPRRLEAVHKSSVPASIDWRP